jgi:hypothetical protein
MAWSFVSAPLTVLTGGQALVRMTNRRGFVMEIRTLRGELEDFFEKNDNHLPMADLGHKVVMNYVA